MKLEMDLAKTNRDRTSEHFGNSPNFHLISIRFQGCFQKAQKSEMNILFGHSLMSFRLPFALLESCQKCRKCHGSQGVYQSKKLGLWSRNSFCTTRRLGGGDAVSNYSIPGQTAGLRTLHGRKQLSSLIKSPKTPAILVHFKLPAHHSSQYLPPMFPHGPKKKPLTWPFTRNSLGELGTHWSKGWLTQSWNPVTSAVQGDRGVMKLSINCKKMSGSSASIFKYANS